MHKFVKILNDISDYKVFICQEDKSSRWQEIRNILVEIYSCFFVFFVANKKTRVQDVEQHSKVVKRIRFDSENLIAKSHPDTRDGFIFIVRIFTSLLVAEFLL